MAAAAAAETPLLQPRPLGTSGLVASLTLTNAATGEPQAMSPGGRALYVGDEDIRGRLTLHAEGSQEVSVPHDGLYAELEGRVEAAGADPVVFVQSTLKVSRGGTLRLAGAAVRGEDTDAHSPGGPGTEGGLLPPEIVYPLHLNAIDKTHESYIGSNVWVVYVLRIVLRGRPRVSVLGVPVGSNPIHTTEFPVWVVNYQMEPKNNPPLSLTFGFDEALVAEVQYASSKFALDDVIVGVMYFDAVRIPVDSVALSLVRVESVAHGPGSLRKSRPVFYHEIADGCPVRDEGIPIRIFLSDYPLTPTYKSVHNVFSVKYVLNIIILDTAGRRYYKQQEIILWRRPPRPRSDSLSSSLSSLSSLSSSEPHPAQQLDI